MKMQISLPHSLNLEDTLRFAKQIDDCSAADIIQIDVGEERWIPPFSMLFVAKKIRQIKDQNPNIKLFIQNYQNHKYLGHMGFFRMCGIDYGRDVGEAWGSKTYIPIRCVRRDQLYSNPQDRFSEIQDLIQRHCDEVAEILTRDKQRSSNIFNVLSYSLREVFRNVFEHSKCNELFYCGQFWPTKQQVEVSIADSGIGIRRALSENPNFRLDSDKEALEMSLLPTVSGKTHAARLSENWFNSGYGLYMTNRLARNGGNFVIASGNTAIYLSRKTKYNYQTSYPGTVLRLKFDVMQIGDVAKRLVEFREEGARMAAAVKGSAGRPPSAMSLLLRRDFRPTRP